eukprot:1160397-Pelagomonas_calceolata.AAC.1
MVVETLSAAVLSCGALDAGAGAVVVWVVNAHAVVVEELMMVVQMPVLASLGAALEVVALIMILEAPVQVSAAAVGVEVLLSMVEELPAHMNSAAAAAVVLTTAKKACVHGSPAAAAVVEGMRHAAVAVAFFEPLCCLAVAAAAAAAVVVEGMTHAAEAVAFLGPLFCLAVAAAPAAVVVEGMTHAAVAVVFFEPLCCLAAVAAELVALLVHHAAAAAVACTSLQRSWWQCASAPSRAAEEMEVDYHCKDQLCCAKGCNGCTRAKVVDVHRGRRKRFTSKKKGAQEHGTNTLRGRCSRAAYSIYSCSTQHLLAAIKCLQSRRLTASHKAPTCCKGRNRLPAARGAGGVPVQASAPASLEDKLPRSLTCG